LWGTFPALQAHLLSIDSRYPPLSAYLVPICAALALAAAAYVLRIRRRTWRYEPRAAAVLILGPIVALQPAAAVVTAAIVSAAFVWGSLILRRLGQTTSGGAAGLAFPAILGFAFLSVVLFALGTLRLLDPWLLGLAVAATAVLGRRSIQAGLGESLVRIDAAWRSCRSLSRPGRSLLSLLHDRCGVGRSGSFGAAVLTPCITCR
jgi:hypothetical protein